MSALKYTIAVALSFLSLIALAEPSNSRIAAAQVSVLSDACYENWTQQQWKIGQSTRLAASNPAYSNGIQNICQAKAELYYEGYEITPFISEDERGEVNLIVFLPSVDEIKNQLRAVLPELRVL
jgi:hypothetical protein